MKEEGSLMKITKASPKKENFDKVYILRHKYNEEKQKIKPK